MTKYTTKFVKTNKTNKKPKKVKNKMQGNKCTKHGDWRKNWGGTK
tara:strand:+ start:164 stop:298 length:135 start_codon:yes stop_codon:yes gene_type:complete